MKHTTKICNNCGAVCDGNDTYCQRCSRSFPKNDDSQKPVLEGITDGQFRDFVDKRTEYYRDKFAKSPDKPWFIQLNWSALLFGPTWFFYRKMYKQAIVYCLLLLLVNSFFCALLPVAFSSQVEEFQAAKTAYTEYEDGNNDIIMFDENMESYYHPDYIKVKEDLQSKQNTLRWICFFMYVPGLAVNIGTRLFANAIYKKHIQDNILYSSRGGTSLKSAFAGMLILNLFTSVIWEILYLIPAVTTLEEAMQSFINFYM